MTNEAVRERWTFKCIYQRGLRKSFVKFWKYGCYRKFFYQDNFKTPFNRLIGCKLFGHRHIRKSGIDGSEFCFNCYRRVK
jgi:hypothetical protein